MNLHSTVADVAERCKDALKPLFPNSVGNRLFMLTFEHAINNAKGQVNTYLLVQELFYTDTNTVHLPHRDIESFYWLCLGFGALACAIPADSAFEMNCERNVSCQTVLNYTSDSKDREWYLYRLALTDLVGILPKSFLSFDYEIIN